MLRVEMLPARKGDALWIEYGEGDRVHRVLIDGGYASTIEFIEPRIRRIAAAEGGTCHFELMIISHVDADHIAGGIELVGRPSLPLSFGDIWFNGRHHLDRDMLGGHHGLYLQEMLRHRDLPWNEAFGGKSVVVPDDGPLPTVTLPGGLVLTLVSPTWQRLVELAKTWDGDVREQGLDGASLDQVLAHLRDKKLVDDDFLGGTKPSGPIGDIDQLLAVPDSSDSSNPNGSSIAVLARYGGRSVLLAADAHHEVLVAAVDRMVGPEGILEVDAFKLPHHGSRHNVSAELLRRIHAQHFLISSNGSYHYHPDREAIARVVAGDWRVDDDSIDLVFNYRSDFSEVWDLWPLREQHRFRTWFPPAGDEGLAWETDTQTDTQTETRTDTEAGPQPPIAGDSDEDDPTVSTASTAPTVSTVSTAPTVTGATGLGIATWVDGPVTAAADADASLWLVPGGASRADSLLTALRAAGAQPVVAQTQPTAGLHVVWDWRRCAVRRRPWPAPATRWLSVHQADFAQAGDDGFQGRIFDEQPTLLELRGAAVATHLVCVQLGDVDRLRRRLACQLLAQAIGCMPAATRAVSWLIMGDLDVGLAAADLGALTGLGLELSTARCADGWTTHWARPPGTASRVAISGGLVSVAGTGMLEAGDEGVPLLRLGVDSGPEEGSLSAVWARLVGVEVP